MSQYVEWSALGQVVLAGLLVGAGLPALFALGLRLLSARPTGETGVEAEGAGTVSAAAVTTRPTVLRLVGAIACFAVVLGAVVTGIVFLVAGGH